ncbi:MAG TPA: glycosyltransferase family 4 protein [Streptosporangiaceae bacterium]|nr:glycosyltransferase family 4 protein [Streptosporangiaceae bacterium]
MPMRIAFVLGTASGGTAGHAAMLARGCVSEGLEVHAFGPASTRQLFGAGQAVDPAVPAPGAAAGPARRGAAAEPARGPGGIGAPGDATGFEPVPILERPRPARDAAAILRLRGLLRQIRPDVVHAHGLRAGAFAALALAGRPRHRAALLVTVHNAPPRGRAARSAYCILERICARQADAVLCVSADLEARMRRRRARRVALAVVPAPPARAPAAQAVQAARSDIGAGRCPIVLAVGRLAEQKGHGVLLAAAAAWQRRDPRPLLVIAGGGPLAGELARSDADIAVRFLGQRADVPALLRAADVFVVASSWEGQPLVIQEALQAGLPIVACSVGGIPELTGTDAALLVPPGDPPRLAAAVLSVLEDEPLAARLAAAARARAAQLPSEADALAAVTALYGQLAAAGQRPLAGS